MIERPRQWLAGTPAQHYAASLALPFMPLLSIDMASILVVVTVVIRINLQLIVPAEHALPVAAMVY